MLVIIPHLKRFIFGGNSVIERGGAFPIGRAVLGSVRKVAGHLDTRGQLLQVRQSGEDGQASRDPELSLVSHRIKEMLFLNAWIV
jgi:hypothetical protein